MVRVHGAALRAGFMTGLPRFARNDEGWCVFAALERMPRAWPAPTWIILRTLGSLPGNHFEALKGDRNGQYSIRIIRQWRVCFEWPNGAIGPSRVEIVDYH